MRLILAVFLGLSAICAPAHAQERAPATQTSEPSIESLARQYIELGGSEDMFLEGAVYGFREAARARGVTFTPEQRAQLDTVVRQHFREASEIFVGQLVTYYATHASREDLTVALAFYRSRDGERYIAASLEYLLPLSLYLATNGLTTLPDFSEGDVSPERRARARDLAVAMSARMHESERVALDASPIGVDGVTEYVARSLAGLMNEAEMEAAIRWVQSEAGQRLEGVSAERTLATQTAIMLAMRTVDNTSLQQAVVSILAQDPT